MSRLLCIQSHYGTPGVMFREAATRKDAIVVRQSDLTERHLDEATGLITTMHLDQDGLVALHPALERFLNREGRWFFNGHMLRRFVDGLELYHPIPQAGRKDLRLTVLSAHPVFTHVDRYKLGARKGVAGFYGRGHNPLPEGALPVTGVGPQTLPLDWDWARPQGGRIFSHAGNDLPGACEAEEDSLQIARNIISWVLNEEDSTS